MQESSECDCRSPGEGDRPSGSPVGSCHAGGTSSRRRDSHLRPAQLAFTQGDRTGMHGTSSLPRRRRSQPATGDRRSLRRRCVPVRSMLRTHRRRPARTCRPREAVRLRFGVTFRGLRERRDQIGEAGELLLGEHPRLGTGDSVCHHACLLLIFRARHRRTDRRDG